MYDEGHLRKYLLGELKEEEQQAVEEGLLADDEIFDLLLSVEDELIDDYVSGALSAEERKRFESFFLSTSERQRKLSFAMSLRRYVTAEAGALTTQPELAKPSPRVTRPSSVIGHLPLWWKQAFSSPYLRMAAVAVVVLGLGLGIRRVFFYQSEVAKGMAALAKAYRVERPTEARITGLNYAPLSNTRGAEQPKVDELALDRAERILLDEVAEHPSPASHHALGRLYLAERKFDKAIPQFDDALRGDPNNAQLHADYGALLLEKGKADRLSDDSGKGLEELARSLEHLNKALELNSLLLEALFNRALVHQEMDLPEQAEEVWRKYLEKDSSSKWAEEARENLNQLDEQRKKTSQTKEDLLKDFLRAYESRDDEKAWEIVSRSRDALSGMMIWEQLVDGYLEAWNQGQSDRATGNIQALLYLGGLESVRSGDSYSADLARFYRSSSQKQLNRLARGRQLFRLGQKYSADGKARESAETLRECRQVFASAGDQLEAEYAEQWIGYSFLQSSLTKQSIAILSALVGRLEREDRKWLLMRTLHLLSGAEYNLGEYSKAIDLNLRSLALAEQIGDAVGVFNASSILAEQYRYIDNSLKSLECIEASLSIIHSCALSPYQIAQHYAIIALSLMSSGLYPAAIDYQTEALRRARVAGRPRTITVAYIRLGLVYSKIGKYREAIENAGLAYDTARSIPDDRIRRTMMALSSLAAGDIHREAEEFNNAIDSYDEALKLYASMDFQYGVYEAHKNRLLCYLSTQQDSAANEELKTTLNLIEKHRSVILDGENRNNFFDTAQSVYDIAIDFAFSRMHNEELAFDYSEESRSRSLLDSVNGDSQVSVNERDSDLLFTSHSEPLRLAKIRARLPKGRQIIQYAVLTDKILIWVISERGFWCQQKDVSQRELNEKVRSYLQLLTGASETNEGLMGKYATELFDWLMRPVEPLLDKANLLYIVPDKILTYLPFAALRSSDSGRFFVEDHLLATSPSSTLFVLCSDAAIKKGRAEPERILSVGNPIFDRSKFPGLADLPSAAKEAHEIAAYYDSRCLLIGDAATKNRVITEMQRADIIHLAAHSVVDVRSPLHSKLLLTRDRKGIGDERSSDGILEAQEIYKLKLSRARVVLLSACQTGAERYYSGEGMISFARPFLSAGVSLVVVSLWPIDSAATAKLMSALHKHRKREKTSTTEALVLAQRDLIGSNDETVRQPYCWASFIVVGASSSF